MEKPKRYKRFESEYPTAAEAYENLGKQIHSCGPLDSKTRTLIKIAISTGAGLEGALHSHTRKAVEADAEEPGGSCGADDEDDGTVDEVGG